MPYEIRGRSVYKRVAGRLIVIKRHPSHKAALAHFRALQAAYHRHKR